MPFQGFHHLVNLCLKITDDADARNVHQVILGIHHTVGYTNARQLLLHALLFLDTVLHVMYRLVFFGMASVVYIVI